MNKFVVGERVIIAWADFFDIGTVQSFHMTSYQDVYSYDVLWDGDGGQIIYGYSENTLLSYSYILYHDFLDKIADRMS